MNSILITHQKWYLFFTESYAELKIAEILSRKKITYFNPTIIYDNPQQAIRKPAPRQLFNNIIFIQLTEQRITEVKSIEGIQAVLYRFNAYATITDEDIEKIRHFVSNFQNIQAEKIAIHWPSHRKNRKVTTDAASDENIFIDHKRKKISLRLTSIGYLLTASIALPAQVQL